MIFSIRKRIMKSKKTTRIKLWQNIRKNKINLSNRKKMNRISSNRSIQSNKIRNKLKNKMKMIVVLIMKKSMMCFMTTKK
jgi:chromosome condensin MukBEF MukE localization factor